MNNKHLRTVTLVFGFCAVLLTSCDPPTNANLKPKFTPRVLPSDLTSRKAVSYSGMRGSTADQAPTPAQIAEDLDLLDIAGFKLLRLFSSSDNFSKVTLETIRDQHYDMKVQLGVWIQGSGQGNFESDNQAEIARGVKLAQDFKNIVVGVSVGNEKLVDWQSQPNKVTTDQLVGYIQQVRDQVPQPVTTDDNWAVFANFESGYETKKLVAAIDYVSLHTYPLSDSMHADMKHPEVGNAYWDWFQSETPTATRAAAMMEAALEKAKKDYSAAKTYLDSLEFSDRVIVIGETGWKTSPSEGENMRAHPINQKMYLDGLAAWTDGPSAIFYFEAFDEPWKGGDDKWGLFSVDRKAKYALYSAFTATADQMATSGEAVYYAPPAAKTPVDSANYAVYVDSPPAGMTTPSGDLTPLLQWIGWDSGPVTASAADATDTPDEGGHYLRVTPNPKEWGWGFFAYIQNLEDLSKYEAGHLNFSIRTTYAGKLEFGFHTDDGVAGADVYTTVDAGQYGYAHDGTWHHVSIPISVLLATSTSSNIHYVNHAFTIADRYAKTGKAAGAHITTTIDIDNIYWSKN